MSILAERHGQDISVQKKWKGNYPLLSRNLDESSPRNFFGVLASFRWVKRHFTVCLANFRIHRSEISFLRNFARTKIRVCEISQNKILLAIEAKTDGTFVALTGLSFKCYLRAYCTLILGLFHLAFKDKILTHSTILFTGTFDLGLTAALELRLNDQERIVYCCRAFLFGFHR